MSLEGWPQVSFESRDLENIRRQANFRANPLRHAGQRIEHGGDPHLGHLTPPQDMRSHHPHFRGARALALPVTRPLEPIAMLLDETQGLALRATRRDDRDRGAIAPQREPVVARPVAALEHDVVGRGVRRRRRVVHPGRRRE